MKPSASGLLTTERIHYDNNYVWTWTIVYTRHPAGRWIAALITSRTGTVRPS